MLGFEADFKYGWKDATAQISLDIPTFDGILMPPFVQGQM